ncbi:MAG: hypothetical protein U0U69_05740 [Acidimicrobiia bacterium]
MAEIVQRSGSVPAARGGVLRPRAQRELARRVDNAEADGVVAAARIRAAAYATHTALTETAILSNIEAQLVKLCPLGEARYQAIVDSFAGVAVAEVMRLGR